MNGESLDIKQEMLQKLRGLFPELFAEGQLDWEKLKINTVLQMRDAGIDFKTI